MTFYNNAIAKQKVEVRPIQSIDAKTLTERECPSIEFVVDRLLPQGLHILAGSPKVGKSWFVLHMCNQIALGEPVWDYTTKQGTVLYICLEDTYRRIQSRLDMITENPSDALYIAIESGSLQSSLPE